MTQGRWTVLARLVRPHGRHGELSADILTDFPERFAERKRLFLARPGTYEAGQPSDPREVSLEESWLHQGRVVLKFATIDSIDQAETLRGLDVLIPSEERAPLEEGAVYIDDLIGCRVFDMLSDAPGSTPTDVGEVVDVDRDSGAGDLLVVKPPAGAELLIPFVRAFLRHVDLDRKRIEMDLPQGLLELNAPLSAEEKDAAQRNKEL